MTVAVDGGCGGGVDGSGMNVFQDIFIIEVLLVFPRMLEVPGFAIAVLPTSVASLSPPLPPARIVGGEAGALPPYPFAHSLERDMVGCLLSASVQPRLQGHDLGR